MTVFKAKETVRFLWDQTRFVMHSTSLHSIEDTYYNMAVRLKACETVTWEGCGGRGRGGGDLDVSVEPSVNTVWSETLPSIIYETGLKRSRPI